MLLKSYLNAKVVYSRLVRIHFDHSQKKNSDFWFFAFSTGPTCTGGSENLKTPMYRGGYYNRSISIFCLLWHDLDLLHILRSRKKSKAKIFNLSPSPTAIKQLRKFQFGARIFSLQSTDHNLRNKQCTIRGSMNCSYYRLVCSAITMWSPCFRKGEGNKITENQKGWAFWFCRWKGWPGVLVKTVEQGWGFRSYSKHWGEKGTYDTIQCSCCLQKQCNI